MWQVEALKNVGKGNYFSLKSSPHKHKTEEITQF